MLVRGAFAAISRFDDYLEDNPLDFEIRDPSCLPLPKNVLIEAFQIELSQDRRVLIREFLLELGLKLAFFQYGLGALAIRPVPAALLQMDDGAPSPDLFEVIALQRRQIETFHELYCACLAERRMLEGLFGAAIAQVSPWGRTA